MAFHGWGTDFRIVAFPWQDREKDRLQTALHKILPYLDELWWPMTSNDSVKAVFGSGYINGRCM